MRTLKDLKEFAREELERIKEGSGEPLRDFEALKTLCNWCLEVEQEVEEDCGNCGKADCPSCKIN